MAHNNESFDNRKPPGHAYTRRRFLITSGSLAGLTLSPPFLGQLLAAHANPDQELNTVESVAAGLISHTQREALKGLLKEVCDWIMTQDLGSGVLKNTVEHNLVKFIFISGNLARVLLSGSVVLDKSDYLAEALRWCDNLADHQQPVATANGREGGYWGTRGGNEGDIFFGDTGTATTMLALGYKHGGAARQRHYLPVMEKFSRFIRLGCSKDPQGKGRGSTPSWIVQTGKDRGALGCGYYSNKSGHISAAPYIIATATTGAAFHSLLYSIDKRPEHAAVAADAVRWILAQQLKSGEFPYIISGKISKREHWPLDTMTYCGEGLIAVYLYLNESTLRRQIARGVKSAIEWLLRTQNEDGSWGKMGSQDRQRSPSCVTLLAWYYRTVDADPRIAESVRKYCQFLLDPANQGPYGCKRLVRTTGFIGLVLADLLKPGVTFH